MSRGHAQYAAFVPDTLHLLQALKVAGGFFGFLVASVQNLP